MKKFIFITVMLLATTALFCQAAATAADDVDVQSIVDKSDQVYQDFQQKFKTLKNYDTSKRSKDSLKEMVDMVNRYKKLVDEKIIEIDSLEKAGRPVSALEFNQLKNLIDRYHEMSVNLANWINTR